MVDVLLISAPLKQLTRVQSLQRSFINESAAKTVGSGYSPSTTKQRKPSARTDVVVGWPAMPRRPAIEFDVGRMSHQIALVPKRWLVEIALIVSTMHMHLFITPLSHIDATTATCHVVVGLITLPGSFREGNSVHSGMGSPWAENSCTLLPCCALFPTRIHCIKPFGLNLLKSMLHLAFPSPSEYLLLVTWRSLLQDQLWGSVRHYGSCLARSNICRSHFHLMFVFNVELALVYTTMWLFWWFSDIPIFSR